MPVFFLKSLDFVEGIFMQGGGDKEISAGISNPMADLLMQTEYKWITITSFSTGSVYIW